jgi:hypothetical protein
MRTLADNPTSHENLYGEKPTKMKNHLIESVHTNLCEIYYWCYGFAWIVIFQFDYFFLDTRSHGVWAVHDRSLISAGVVVAVVVIVVVGCLLSLLFVIVVVGCFRRFLLLLSLSVIVVVSYYCPI